MSINYHTRIGFIHWLLSSVEAILPAKLSLSYGQRLFAHSYYARSSAPAFPVLHFKGFRICRPHPVVNDASPVVSRSIYSDCRAVHSCVGTSGGSIGGAGSLASHLLAELGGFGTDPEMPAVFVDSIFRLLPPQRLVT